MLFIQKEHAMSLCGSVGIDGVWAFIVMGRPSKWKTFYIRMDDSLDIRTEGAQYVKATTKIFNFSSEWECCLLTQEVEKGKDVSGIRMFVEINTKYFYILVKIITRKVLLSIFSWNSGPLAVWLTISPTPYNTVMFITLVRICILYCILYDLNHSCLLP